MVDWLAGHYKMYSIDDEMLLLEIPAMDSGFTRFFDGYKQKLDCAVIELKYDAAKTAIKSDSTRFKQHIVLRFPCTISRQPFTESDDPKNPLTHDIVPYLEERELANGTKTNVRAYAVSWMVSKGASIDVESKAPEDRQSELDAVNAKFANMMNNNGTGMN